MPELISSEEKFKEKIQNTTLTVVHFSAKWAEQCKQVDDVLDALSTQDSSTGTFIKCEAEDLADISLKYKIESVPTVVLFRSGNVIDRIEGADAAKITTKISEHMNKDSTLNDRLKKLVNRHNVMLFMKGDRTTPRCGFSKTIIEILNGTGVSYETFDILSDEEVRQGLKTYSNWPTYPQLYAKGELLGGLDIIKEMLADGELLSTLTDDS